MRRPLLSVIGVLIAAELVATVLLVPDFGQVGMVVIVFTIATSAIGVLLATRLPRHPIGWLLLLASLSAATGALAVTYAELALADYPGRLPVSHWVIWLGEVSFLVAVVILSAFLLLLFPTGRPLSSRWTPVMWFAGVSAVLMGLGRVLSPESFADLPIANPIALEADALLLLLVDGGGFYLFSLMVLLSLWSVLLRYRHAKGVERQQLKMAVFGMSIATLGLVGPLLWELLNGSAEIPGDLENLLVMLGLTTIPITIGLAVLRYRLYDIDRIISRTVSYALVVGLLGMAFAAGVLLVPNAVSSLEGSPLLVAASTLVVAASFNPLRRKVQSSVDRRFNRSRYDSERVVESFAGSLRDRVDPEDVVDGWLGVVSGTMQPSFASIWVRS